MSGTHDVLRQLGWSDDLIATFFDEPETYPQTLADMEFVEPLACADVTSPVIRLEQPHISSGILAR